MNEEFINYSTAILAKEKGFRLGSGWQIRSLYNIKDGETFCEKTRETPDYACERCSQSLLQRWLREVHEIHIHIQYLFCFSKNNDKQLYFVYINNDDVNTQNGFNTYEQALEKGLLEALKLIK